MRMVFYAQVAVLEDTVADQRKLIDKKDAKIAELHDKQRQGPAALSVQAAGM